jgi:hypothetical protein
MKFSTFLKTQLTDFVEAYRKYFWRTFGAAINYSVLCFVAIALLLRFSEFDAVATKKQLSIFSYIFHRYSAGTIYSLVDLSKSVFLFFVGLFSLSLSRIMRTTEGIEELSFGSFLKHLQGRDVLVLLVILISCLGLDFGLVKLDIYTTATMTNHSGSYWIHGILNLVDIYLPLMLISISIFWLLTGKVVSLGFKKLLFLWSSLWLFNEFAFEISMFVRSHIFGLFLIPLNEEHKYLYESFFALPLLAFYFIGYHSAMTTSVRLIAEDSKSHDSVAHKD